MTFEMYSQIDTKAGYFKNTMKMYLNSIQIRIQMWLSKVCFCFQGFCASDLAAKAQIVFC